MAQHTLYHTVKPVQKTRPQFYSFTVFRRRACSSLCSRGWGGSFI